MIEDSVPLTILSLFLKCQLIECGCCVCVWRLNIVGK